VRDRFRKAEYALHERKKFHFIRLLYTALTVLIFEIITVVVWVNGCFWDQIYLIMYYTFKTENKCALFKKNLIYKAT
jgi:hypothetical protein